MLIKLLHLNIFQGKLLPKIIDFVKQNDIDIAHLQEVTSGKMSEGGKYPEKLGDRTLEVNEEAVGIDCFSILTTQLQMDGEFVKTYGFINQPDSSTRNATLFKKNIKVIEKKVIWLRDYKEISPDSTEYASFSTAALVLVLEMNAKKITSVNTHLAWGPNSNDEPYKTEQANKLLTEIRDISEPFVFTGDFNVTPETETASMFDILGRNLTKEFKITNTLNPALHAKPTLYPPGLAVDQFFVSKNLNIRSFRLVDEIDLSDHFGLFLEFDL